MTRSAPVPLPEGRPSRAGAVLEELASRHPFPIAALLSLTERCNLKCAHCFVPRPETEQLLSIGELESLLDALKEAGVLFLTLTGGEPALRPDLELIVRAAAERSFAIRLKTNGTLLPPVRGDALFEAGLTHVDISLYHINPARHDAFVAMPGAWDLAVRAAEHFGELGAHVSISIIAMSWNWESIADLMAFAGEKRFSFSVSPTIICRTDCCLEPLALQLEESVLASVLQDPRLFDAQAVARQTPKAGDSGLCRGGLDTVFIQPNGDVRLCQRLPWALGNIRDSTFAEIWRESEVRQSFLRWTWQDLPECSQCELSWACVRCPASALLENGDLLGKSPGDCLLARARALVCGRARSKADQRG